MTHETSNRGPRQTATGVEILEERVVPCWIEGVPAYKWGALVRIPNGRPKSVSVTSIKNPFEDAATAEKIDQELRTRIESHISKDPL